MFPICHFCLPTFVYFLLRFHYKSCDTNNEKSNSQSITTNWIACICLRWAKWFQKLIPGCSWIAALAIRRLFVHCIHSSHPITHYPPANRMAYKQIYYSDQVPPWALWVLRYHVTQSTFQTSTSNPSDVWRGVEEIYCPRV